MVAIRSKIFKVVLNIIIVVILLGLLFPVTVIVQAQESVSYELPKLTEDKDYYQSFFPSGLRYSSAWCGTFTYMPSGLQHIMFDDDYSKDFGMCIFSLPKGTKSPSGAQGGTTLKILAIKEAEDILKSYDVVKLAKPYDQEILEVMEWDHKFIGAQSGVKLAQKFTSVERSKITETIRDEVTGEVKTIESEKPLTERQQEYINDTQNIVVKSVDLEKYDPDRYFVMGQVFFTDGTANCSLDGRQVADSAFTVDGAGNFTIHMASGTTGTVSGTNLDGSPVALAAGLNTITTSGAVADGAFDITIGTAANWNTVNSWSAASGGACGASIPTNADNVYFNANSFTAGSQVLTVNAAAYCLAMDWIGATNSPTLAHSAVLNIYGAYTGIAGMAHSGTSAINLVSTGAVNFTAGVTFSCPLTFNGAAGQWTLQDTLNIGTQTLTLAQGTLVTNNQTITCGSVTISGASAKVLTSGASTINCTSWSYTGSNLTITANTATINISGTGALAGGNVDYNGASFNLNGTAHTVSGSFTCNVLTRNGTATKTDSVTFTSGTTITCTTFAMKGNSSTNRLLVQSSTLGTAATITATNWTGSQNVDLMDITATNAVDLSAITGLSGDCGGNTGITFTPAAAQTSTGAGSWSGAIWTSRVPLPQDDVSCSHNVTVDMPRIGKSITFTGTPTITKYNNISVYGSLTLASGMTLGGSYGVSLRGRGAFTFSNAGKDIYQLFIYAPTGTYTATLTGTVTSGGSSYLFGGTLNIVSQTCTFWRFGVSGASAVLNITNSSITLNGTSAGTSPWDIVGLSTFTSTGSTIIITNSTANAQTFAGGGLTYNNVTVSGAGDYALTITGSNTFNNLSIDASQAAKTVKFTDLTTTTLSDLTRDAGGTNIITLQGTAVAGWNLTKSDAIPVNLDYLSVDYSNATQTNIWYAGIHSTDGTHNTNWTFDDAPLTVTTNAATGITMDKDGVTGGTFNGTIGTIDGTPYMSYYFEYGLTAAYGSSTVPVACYSCGAVSSAIPTVLTPGETYHYRAVVTNANAGSPFVGLDETFTFTMPTVSTSAASGIIPGSYTLNGNLSNLGVATDCYVYFEYGETPAYGYQTTDTTKAATGTYSDTNNVVNISQSVYFRAVAKCGTVVSNGSQLTFSSIAKVYQFTGLPLMLYTVPVIILIVILPTIIGITGMRTYRGGDQSKGIILIGIGVVFLIIAFFALNFIIEAIKNILTAV